MGFTSSHQLKSYVASISPTWNWRRAVLSADAGLLVPVVDTCLSYKYTARQSWRSFASCICSKPCAVHSDLHSKFTPRPHRVWKYLRPL